MARRVCGLNPRPCAATFALVVAIAAAGCERMPAMFGWGTPAQNTKPAQPAMPPAPLPPPVAEAETPRPVKATTKKSAAAPRAAEAAAAPAAPKPEAAPPAPMPVAIASAPDPAAASVWTTEAPEAEPAPPLVDLTRIYSSEDPDVIPPRLLTTREGNATLIRGLQPDMNTMELVVSEVGKVEQVRLLTPARRMTDMLLLSGAKTWTFAPAMLNGQPVRYRTVFSWPTVK